jgi:hypothetical protein
LGDHDVYTRGSWKEAWKAFADTTFDNSVVWARAETRRFDHLYGAEQPWN